MCIPVHCVGLDRDECVIQRSRDPLCLEYGRVLLRYSVQRCGSVQVLHPIQRAKKKKQDLVWRSGGAQTPATMANLRFPTSTSSSVNFKFRPRNPDDLRNGLSVLRPHHEQSGAIYHGDRSSDCKRVSSSQIAGGSFSFPVHPAQHGVVHNHYSSQDVRVRQGEKGQHNTNPDTAEARTSSWIVCQPTLINLGGAR